MYAIRDCVNDGRDHVHVFLHDGDGDRGRGRDHGGGRDVVLHKPG